MYRINLPNFEGPFDLLLYFIKRDEINIYDIPISRITHDFLEYIRLMKHFDIELAGEFILMASNLIYIKTQMLLPRPKNDDDDETVEDPRTQLVQKLLEYKKFKDASVELSELYENQRYTYYRNIFDLDKEYASADAVYKNATLFDLLKAFQKMMHRAKVDSIEHVVEIQTFTVEQQSKFLLGEIKAKGRISFLSITEDLYRNQIIVMFLSILELLRSKKIYITQNNNFDDIIIAAKHDLN